MRLRRLLLALALVVGCTASGVAEREAPDAEQKPARPHPACEVGDEDRRCTVDEDCAYLGTFLARQSSECCYDPCGGGFAVNRESIARLEAAREPLLSGPPRKTSHCPDRSEVKGSYGGVYCVACFCEQRNQAFR